MDRVPLYKVLFNTNKDISVMGIDDKGAANKRGAIAWTLYSIQN